MESHNCATSGEWSDDGEWWICSDCGDEYASREIALQVSSKSQLISET